MRERNKEQQIQQVQKNYVQMPDFTQSFNRYSYALNNPLKYVDENGEFFGLMGGFIRGLYIQDKRVKSRDKRVEIRE